MSDSYAAALWAADYVLKAACAGFAGVNLHGGGVGVYTPIESSANAPAAPRPVYHGLEFAQKFVGASIAPCALSTSANITAYQANRAGKPMLAFVNKGESSVRVELPASFAKAKQVQRWNMRGPSLSAKAGIEFGAAPNALENSATEIPAYSAAIFQVD